LSNSESDNPAVQLAELTQKTNELNFQVESLKRENERLRDELAEAKREAFKWHQEAIRAGEVNTQLQNELAAVLKAKRDFRDQAVEYMLTIREQQLRIDNALKFLRGPRAIFGKWLAVTILGLAVLAYFYFKYKLRDTAEHYAGNEWGNIDRMVVCTRGFGKAVVAVENTLDQDVSCQLQGSNSKAWDTYWDIGAPFTVSAGVNSYETLTDMFPYLRLRAVAPIAPTTGYLNAFCMLSR